MDRRELKERFRNGAYPDERDYAALIDLTAERRTVDAGAMKQGDQVKVPLGGGEVVPMVRVMAVEEGGLQDVTGRMKITYRDGMVEIINTGVGVEKAEIVIN